MVFLTYIPFYLPSPGTWRAQSASARLPSLLFRRCVTTHDLVGLAQLLCAAAALSCCYRDVNATVVCCWRAVNIWHPHGPKSTRGPPVSRQFGITIVQELRFSSVKWVREKLEKKFEMLYFFFSVLPQSSESFLFQVSGVTTLLSYDSLHVLLVIQEKTNKQDNLEMWKLNFRKCMKLDQKMGD